MKRSWVALVKTIDGLERQVKVLTEQVEMLTKLISHPVHETERLFHDLEQKLNE